MRSFSVGRVVTPFVLLLGLMLLTSCVAIPMSKGYMGNTTYGTSIITPGDWKSFDASAVLPDASEGAQAYIEAFGVEGIDPTQPMFGGIPGGMLIVNLYPGLTAGRTAARNALVSDLDAAIAAGTVSILEESAPVLEGLWERRSLLLEVRLEDANNQALASPSGTVMKVLQETMLATRATGKDAAGMDLFPLKTLILGCSLECFAANAATLLDVKNSWRVE